MELSEAQQARIDMYSDEYEENGYKVMGWHNEGLVLRRKTGTCLKINPHGRSVSLRKPSVTKVIEEKEKKFGAVGCPTFPMNGR